MKEPSHINLHSIARQAMENYGFASKFSEAALREAEAIRSQLDNAQFRKSFVDLTGLLWSSIDNVDSEDLDQLEYCERGERGEIHVMVAIADVDSYVPKSSLVDQHAAHNGTSVYAEVEVFPMLPECLSTNLSSLIENEDRLAIVVDFFVRKDGNLRFGKVQPAIVRNKAKLVYESAGEWLEKTGPVPEKVAQIQGLKSQILLQAEAAKRMHLYRMEQGALELETIETSVRVEDGQVKEMIIRKKNPARSIIENFMIATNRTMVAFLEKNKFSYIQRILRTPERWGRIRELAFSFNDKLPFSPDSKALSAFLARQRKKDINHFPDLSLAMVKLLGQAEYDLIEPGRPQKGHFGLAVHDYTHSTAPNRRYVDIVIQRLVKAVIKKKNSPYTKKELKELADWCTLRDRSSKKVERFMVKVAGAMLLIGRIGEVFDGIVTGASEKGTYVRLLSPPVEGRVMRRQRGMNVGDKVRVRLLKMEPRRGYIDFEGTGR